MTMAEPPADDSSLTGTALLDRLQKKLARRRPRLPELFRVVEIARDGQGRLVKQGQIWHSDLDHVRRFGRAVAANSVSQSVVIADTSGAVVEKIPVVAPSQAGTAGWSGWRDQPLPPAPARKQTAAPRRQPAAAPPPRDLPVVEVVENAFDVEATTTLAPAPPRET
jgi:hypothetical protein